MVDRIDLVQNDTGPQILLTLADSFTGERIVLTQQGTEVVMNFSTGSTTPKAIIPLFPVVPDPTKTYTTEQLADMVGQCMLDWAAAPVGVLDTPGSYVGEVEITTPEGRIQTTPTKIKFKVRAELG